MKDIILEKFFEADRWEYAIAKGVGKDISKAVLYQLCMPEVRTSMYTAIKNGTYEIAPPHTAQIPKDTPGEFRTVYINEAADRVFLSIANDLLFELTPHCIHKSCKSYLKTIGCGKVVQEASKAIIQYSSLTKLGWKSDLSKYFDSVPLRYIDQAFDMVESIYGKSAIIDVLRKYYHSNLYFDENNVLQEKYQSLKQGCSPASWLADVLLFEIDDKLSQLNGCYVRYSDDALFIGPDCELAMSIMQEELSMMELKLNPKKIEWLNPHSWFKFLGYSLKGGDISLSQTRIKRFQKEIEGRTIRKRNIRLSHALHSVNNYLYRGDNQGHSWATGVLSVITVKEDVNTLNAFVMDCLRAVSTGKKKIGGLGYDKSGKVGCIVRGKGRNVKANREKSGMIEGYLSLGCMGNALRINKPVYDCLTRQL